MLRFEIYMGRGKGWRWGRNTYTPDQIVERAKALQAVGIKFRIVPEEEMYK